MRGTCKGGLGIAVTKTAVAYDVTTDGVMQHDGVYFTGANDLDYRRQGFVFHVDEIEHILRNVATFRYDDRDGLADITHFFDGHAPTFHRRFHADDKRCGPTLDIVAGNDRAHAGKLRRLFAVDGNESRVGVG